MKKEFVMRGKTASGQTEVLNFSGYKPGYAYKLVEFQLYPSASIGSNFAEILGSITAGKTAIDPLNVDFNDEALIGVSAVSFGTNLSSEISPFAQIINDTFLITQNLILMVHDTQGDPVNWQCRFESVKMTGPEEATANYKQFAISDE